MNHIPTRKRLRLVLLLTLGCAAAPPRPQPPPSTAIAAFATAVLRDDPQAAYALLSHAAQKGQPFADFTRSWREYRLEMDAQAQHLLRDLELGTPIDETARLEIDGSELTVCREPGGWRLQLPTMGGMRAKSPLEALRRFASALEARDATSAMRVLSEKRRDALRLLLETFLAGLKARKDADIELAGDRAFLRWNDGKLRWKVSLVREAGEWRIYEINPPE